MNPGKGRSRLVCVLISLLPSVALAQATETPAQALLRQQERERALREQQETRRDIRLPTQQASMPRLPDETPCFPIRSIHLAGEQARYFRWALRAADPPNDRATGRCLGVEGVNIVARRVQNALVTRGYITTRVLVGEQDLSSGSLALTLVPGRIHAVRFADPATMHPPWRNAIPARPGDLLNLRDVEQGLENLQRLPTASADLQIAPAIAAYAGPGDSDLVIAWMQPRRLRGALSLDDAGSRATGQLQAGATVSLDNPFGWDDLLYANVGRGVFNGDDRGTRSWTAHYDVPLDYWLLGVTASGYDYRQEVPGAFQRYEYSGRSGNAELRLSRMLFRNARNTLGMRGRAWWKASRNYIDDTEIGVQRRATAGWALGVDWRRFIGRATVDAGLSYRRGTGAFGALRAPEEAFGEGTSRMRVFNAEAQLAVPFPLGKQRLRYVGGWRAQWNRAPLVAQDRFAIGGRYTVRGFDGEIAPTGDHGWLWRNELDMALGAGQSFYVALDRGHVGGGADSPWRAGANLTGAAIGLRGGVRGLQWDLFVGAPVREPALLPTAYTTTGFNLNWSF